MDPIAWTGPETLSGPCLVRVTGEACLPGRAVRPARASPSLEQGERAPSVRKAIDLLPSQPGGPRVGGRQLFSPEAPPAGPARVLPAATQVSRATEEQRPRTWEPRRHLPKLETQLESQIIDMELNPSSTRILLPSHFHSAPPSFRIHTFSLWKTSSRSYSPCLQPPRLQLLLRVPDFHRKPSDDFRAEADGWGGWLSLALISHAPQGHRLCPHRPHPAQAPPTAQGFHPHLKEGSYAPGDPITVLR